MNQRRHFCNFLSNFNERKARLGLHDVSSSNHYNHSPSLSISSHLSHVTNICIRRPFQRFPSRRPGFPRTCSVRRRLLRGLGRGSFERCFGDLLAERRSLV
ncbi:hypothetical protein CDAR_280091 [Caerostris darwini]|uniref:Uncharacterized protein n=1 Tax=Caerostris darwini TaxID=1538125 RepID=A0AAV4S5J0_9ARAC|nr:hypothetical protein CDAR_280091 [Caerostris darwini]